MSAWGFLAKLPLMLTGRDPYFGWNAGPIAVCINFVTTGLVSLLALRQRCHA